MSIASRIQSIEEHVSDAYDGLENLGVDLTDVDKNIENISSMLDEVWDDYAKVTVTDETFANLEGTKKGKMEISLKGNATQTDTPTPDSPQDISVVTGDNTLKVVGKNMLNLSLIPFNPNNVNMKGGSYTYDESQGKLVMDTRNSTGTATAFSVWRAANTALIVPAGTYYCPCRINFLGVNTGTVNQVYAGVRTLTEPCYIRQWYAEIPAGSVTTIYLSLEANRTTAPTSYEPYTAQTQLLSLGSIELAKIGDYKDRIYKSGGKWYVEKNIGKFTPNGQEETYTYNSTYNMCYLQNYDINPTPLNNEFQMNTALQLITTWTTFRDSTTTNATYRVQPTSYRIAIRNTALTSLEEYQQWLAQGKLTYYYQVATPTTTEITDTTLIEQLEAMQKIKSNDGTTNVFTDGDGSPFYLDVVALKSAN